MNNFFSGHNMAQDIMQKTSLQKQMDHYVEVHKFGGEPIHQEHHPERLDVDFETRKPFLARINRKPMPIIPSLLPDNNHEQHNYFLERDSKPITYEPEESRIRVKKVLKKKHRFTPKQPDFLAITPIEITPRSPLEINLRSPLEITPRSTIPSLDSMDYTPKGYTGSSRASYRHSHSTQSTSSDKEEQSMLEEFVEDMTKFYHNDFADVMRDFKKIAGDIKTGVQSAYRGIVSFLTKGEE